MTDTQTRPRTRGGSNTMLSMHEAAEYLNMHYKTFAGKYRELGIPCVRIAGRVNFLQRHLDTFIETHTELP